MKHFIQKKITFAAILLVVLVGVMAGEKRTRSEEHTSELQSQR